MPLRFWFVIGAFLLSVLLYVDRACVSAAKSEIAADLELSEEQMGWVFAAFAVGYALCQTPAGAAADRFGPRRLLTGIVVLWSIFTGLTGMVRGFLSLITVRLLFGAGEAGAFPGLARATYSWIPISERGLVQGINFSGSRLGAALAFPLIAEMIALIGWRSSFGVLMVVGFAWAMAWWLLFRDTPQECPSITPAELQRIETDRPMESTDAGREHEPELSWEAIATAPTVWLLSLQYFASNFTFYFALSWFLPFFKKNSGLEGTTAAWHSAAPLIAGAFGNWFSGWLVDVLYRRRGPVLARRVPAIMGFVLTATGLVGTAFADTPFATIAWFSLAIFGADMTLSPSWTFAIDVGGRSAGAVSGTMNMAGNIGSFATAMAFPTLLAWAESKGLSEPHEPFFFVAAGLCGVAIVCWLLLDPTKPLAVHERGQA